MARAVLYPSDGREPMRFMTSRALQRLPWTALVAAIAVATRALVGFVRVGGWGFDTVAGAVSALVLLLWTTGIIAVDARARLDEEPTLAGPYRAAERRRMSRRDRALWRTHRDVMAIGLIAAIAGALHAALKPPSEPPLTALVLLASAIVSNIVITVLAAQGDGDDESGRR